MSSIFINKNISQALEYLKNKGSQDQIYFVISQNQKHVRINAEREDFLFIKSLYSDTKEILFKEHNVKMSEVSIGKRLPKDVKIEVKKSK